MELVIFMGIVRSNHLSPRLNFLEIKLDVHHEDFPTVRKPY